MRNIPLDSSHLLLGWFFWWIFRHFPLSTEETACSRQLSSKSPAVQPGINREVQDWIEGGFFQAPPAPEFIMFIVIHSKNPSKAWHSKVNPWARITTIPTTTNHAKPANMLVTIIKPYKPYQTILSQWKHSAPVVSLKFPFARRCGHLVASRRLGTQRAHIADLVWRYERCNV